MARKKKKNKKFKKKGTGRSKRRGRLRAPLFFNLYISFFSSPYLFVKVCANSIVEVSIGTKLCFFRIATICSITMRRLAAIFVGISRKPLGVGGAFCIFK